MKDLKMKDADHKEPTPKQAHTYLNRVFNTCLMIFFISIFLIFAGQLKVNDRMMFIGIGMGSAASLVLLTLNLEEEGDDDER